MQQAEIPAVRNKSMATSVSQHDNHETNQHYIAHPVLTLSKSLELSFKLSAKNLSSIF